MKGFKGFDKDLKCRDKQYKIGGKYREDRAELCRSGLHFCEHPLDCFGYYPLADSRYCEVEADDVSDKTSNDTKRVSKRLKIVTELSIAGMVQAAVKFVFDRAEWTDQNHATGNQGAASATGYRGAASATGDRGAASATGYQGAASATGNQGAASATGYQGAASATGEESVACALGYQCKAAGAIGCWLVLAERDDNGHILSVQTVKVDGEQIKANTFYRLENGQVIE